VRSLDTDLARWLAPQLTGEPREIAVADDGGQLELVLMLSDGSGLRATLDHRHHQDSDDDLRALADVVWAHAVCAWWRAGESAEADVQ
jgi:hypothetical protein